MTVSPSYRMSSWASAPMSRAQDRFAMFLMVNVNWTDLSICWVAGAGAAVRLISSSVQGPVFGGCVKVNGVGVGVVVGVALAVVGLPEVGCNSVVVGVAPPPAVPFEPDEEEPLQAYVTMRTTRARPARTTAR